MLLGHSFLECLAYFLNSCYEIMNALQKVEVSTLSIYLKKKIRQIMMSLPTKLREG